MDQNTDQGKKDKRKKIVIILLSVTNLVTLVLLGFFVFNYFQTDKKLLVTEESLVDTRGAKAELDSLLKQTQLELDQFKGKNAQMDEFLREKNDSLQEFADRIEALLHNGKVTKEQLEKAMEEIDQLRYYKRKYIGQLDSLNTVVIALNQENQHLKSDIYSQKRVNEDLTMDNVRLSTKVAIGAKLNCSNMFVTGIKLRSNGKEKETMRVRQLEQIKVTFQVAENYVTEKGPKDLFVKVIGPDGATLYNEAAGSGTFKFQNEESLYSFKKQIEFNQTAQDIALYWNRGADLAAGKYKLEVFCEGFRIGQAEFELK